MSQPSLQFAVRDAVATITFDQPKRLNALTFAMWTAVPELVRQAEQDDTVRVIALRGAGERAFGAGADISEFAERRNSPDAVAAYDLAVRRANEAILTAEKPTIALIRGTCFGGSFGLAMNCDLRLASEDASFAIPAARLGLGYRFTDIARLARQLGPAATADILISARRLEATEALRLQAIQAVYSTATFEAEAQAYLERIAGNAPLTIRAVKRALSELERTDRPPDHDAADAAADACFTSADYQEGQAAFREKRKPNFTGR